MAGDETTKSSWSSEKEGKLALLLRSLANIQSSEESASVVEQLRALTGEDRGISLANWLSWYLQDHLGIKEARSLLSGKDGLAASPSPDLLGSEPPSQALADEEVFRHPEYNWCALERIKNHDDMLKLRLLYSDLESPLRVDDEGAFSFRRLTGLDESDRAYFRGKSLSQALLSPEVSLAALRALKDYGKMMMMPVFPSSSQRAGAVVYAAAISQAMLRFDSKITTLSSKEFCESLPGLMDRPYIVDSLAKVFRAALEKYS